MTEVMKDLNKEYAKCFLTSMAAIFERIESPGEEPSTKLRPNVLRVVKLAKKHLSELQRRRRTGIGRLNEWVRLGTHDTDLL